uniref:VWFD domain-containing protein n=1 Tax=Loxodonta africana TaxID=9785 RepID=G3U494_LOXAF
TSCKAWICNFPSYRPAPCMALQVYAHACQRLGISIHSWRFQAGCPMECPENSHHELCGSSCPETCAGPSGASCPLPCGETCVCDPGFLRSGPACVLRRPGPGGCGCTHRGLLLAPAEALWEGAGCSLRCLCPAVAGSVLCTSASCGPGERCVLARGLRACGPAGMATCTAAGGGHYVTFDGRRFHLPGPCAYLLSSLSTAATEALTSFRVLLGTGPNGVPSSLEVQVPGYHLQPDRKEPGRVLVNSSWQNLPFQASGGSVLIFRQGWDTVVSCPFGLHVTYAPGIRVLLALSAAYRGRVVGLCADYNSDPTDDLRVPGTAASTKLPEDALTWAFGHSYLVVPLAGCPSVAGKMLPLPPSCATLLTTSTPAHLVQVCDILLDPLGPFRLCNRLLVPDPYFQDCVVDVCLGTGPCPVLGLYCEACQLLSSHVFPWWRPTLCSPLCPQHSHYTLCAPDCPITCAELEEPPGCKGSGRCREGCVCNAGFVLSGATCVPMAQCGCLRAGRYHKPGALLPPLHPASRCCCRCRPGGWVACKFCRPPQRPQGLRFASGESHYHTFDGTIFAYPGACTNLLVGTSPGRLRGMWPLEVVLEKDPGTPGLGPLLLHTGGHRFSLDRDDWGHITVDGVSRSLPFALSMGGARAFAQGASVALVMRGGLRLLFAPCCHLIVTLPAAFRGLTRGLCGNFNGNASDDLKPPRHAPCAALTPHPGSQCPAASKGTGGDAAWLDACGLLSKPEGPLAPCHALLPPEPFFQACVAGVGRARGKQQVLCACLQTYVAACQAAGASVLPWRAPGFCPMRCPPHSHYSSCVNPRPASCLGLQKVVHITTTCAEGCECDDGFFPAGADCVPVDRCSCFRQGQYFPQGSTFWTDNCTQRCQCPALGALVTGLPWCWPDTCNGGLQCRLLTQSSSSPITLEEPLVCTASGDFHFHTFGGAHFAFSGSSVYRLVGLCGTDHHNLEPFSLDLTPLLQSCGCTKALTLSACGLRLDMSPNDLNYIRVDSVLEWLPFSTGRCLRAYRQGRQLCVDMGFDLSLTYDWDSLVRVTLPGSYGLYLCSLCGPSGAGGPGAPLPDAWKVAEVPGCGPTCGSLCPDPCPVAARTSFAGDAHCGLVAAAAGPLGLCFEALDPQPFLHDCLDDVCRHRGFRRAVCRALAAYAVACQALNVSLRPWRTPDFCPLRCPRHSHYELCGQCCPATCAGGERCSGGGRCCEGCACDAGFVLSGAACVPAAQCGCPRAGRYQPLGAVWYPGPRCARRCRCDSDGTVTCAPRPCGRGRVCGLRWGVRLCLARRPRQLRTRRARAPAGFGGRAFLLPASCLDVLAHTVRPGAWPFSLDVARDGAGPPRRALVAQANNSPITCPFAPLRVDGERCWLPWVPPGGSAWATLEGRHTVVHTTYGLRVMYDWGSQVHLTVPSAFRGWLAGLCGPFGGDTGPLDLPLDTRPWSQGPFVPRCPLPPPDHGFHVSCPPRQAQVFRAPELCGLLQAPDGPFGRCLGRISHKPFLRICLQDVCHAHGRRLGLCGALTAYTAACQEAGIPVTPWRGPRLCPLTCPPRHHYSICARTCDGGCALPLSPAHCSSRCHEGCECDPGFTFDGTDCVSQDHCGCFHNRRYVPVGETLVLPGCQEYCMCLPGQDLQCQPLSCPQGTSCILDVGLWRCEAREGAMCRLVPGGLFTTFNGLSGLVPTPFIPFAYELATLVGAGSHDPNWFHVIADFLPCLGCPAPWPRMIISFKDGCVAMGPNQEIWVKG